MYNTLNTIRFLLIFFILFFTHKMKAQDNTMEMYMAEFEKGIGALNYRNDLLKNPPCTIYPYLLVVGPKFTHCNPEGFPDNESFTKANDIMSKIEKIISSSTRIIKAGTFIYQCDYRVYYYVEDSNLLRKKLVEYFAKKQTNLPYYISLKDDKQWEVYKTFLYPSKEILNSNSNVKKLIALKKAGINLEKEREIVFSVSFHRSFERDNYIKKLITEGYTIVGLQKVKTPEFQYQLSFSKSMLLSEESINQITEKLITDMDKLVGNFDSWTSE